jgi:hypothetical protein
MKDEIRIGAVETAVLRVKDKQGSNITNCTCEVLESNIWDVGGNRGTTIPNPVVGGVYKVISECVQMGYGINWEIRSIEKIAHA